MAEIDGRWATMSPEERRSHRFGCWLNPDIEFASPEAEEQYRARVSRFIDAICLERTPDRVPVCTTMGFFPGWHAGLTPYECMTDMKRASEAWYRYNIEFQPDAAISPALNTVPSAALEVLDLQHYSWPGHGVRKEFGYQFNEGEFMLPEEYDELIADPSFFMFRRVLPRMIGACRGMTKLGSPHDLKHLAGCPAAVAGWDDSELHKSLEQMMEAGRIMREWTDALAEVSVRIHEQGFPDTGVWMAEAPFDVIGDSLRGTKGIMLDVYQRPEKLIEACDRMVDAVFYSVMDKTTPDSVPGIFMPLHKGLDAFMSREHFRTFYWPSLRRLVLKFVDEGFVPWLFTEGRYNTRLDIISDLPKGKVVYWLNTTDIFRAKEILGQVGCIQGNVPVSMMSTCGPEEMTRHCRELIERVGVGGGYILDLGAGPDSGRAENIHAMVRAAKEHGGYQ